MVKNTRSRFSMYFVGPSYSGKTALIRTFLGYQWNQQEPPTAAAIVPYETTIVWPRSQEKGSCRMCDTAGSPYFADVVQQYMKGHMIYVVVCSVRDRQSFDAMCELCKVIRKKHKKACIGVIGTCADAGADAQVQPGDFEALCEKKMPYYVVATYDPQQVQSAIYGILAFYEPKDEDSDDDDDDDDDIDETLPAGDGGGGGGGDAGGGDAGAEDYAAEDGGADGGGGETEADGTAAEAGGGDAGGGDTGGGGGGEGPEQLEMKEGGESGDGGGDCCDCDCCECECCDCDCDCDCGGCDCDCCCDCDCDCDICDVCDLCKSFCECCGSCCEAFGSCDC